MERVAQAVKLLTNVDRDEQEFRVMQILAGFKNAGDGEFFGQHYVAQLMEPLLFLGALFPLERLNLVEDCAEVAGRIDSQLVTNSHAELLCEGAAEDGRFTIEVELAERDEFAERDDLLFLVRLDPANHRCEAAILKLDDDRSLNVRGYRDDAGVVANLHGTFAPVAHDVVGRNENVRVEVDHFLAQLAIETGHDRDDENEHGHA